MVLYINACVRINSRTKRLADCVTAQLGDTVREIRLADISFPKVDEDFLQRRTRLASSGDFSDPMFDLARDFASADIIVIAAPFWDLSFPSVLKQYIEQICVTGLTFTYTDGRPTGMCRAGTLYYMTTAGGYISSCDFGYGYIRALASDFFGISDTRLVKAEGLDIIGADADEIVSQAEKEFIAAIDHNTIRGDRS